MRSLARAGDVADLLSRLRRLRPGAERRWGRMTAHQMVCHLRDAFLMGTVEKPVTDATTFLFRTAFKWIALWGPMRWPAGIATSPELDQAIGGTPPSDFATDVASLEAVVARITASPEFFAGRRHPLFGPLSVRAWLRWGYLHMDHHLRQFGA